MADLKWWQENRDAIVFHGCDTLAVFFNADGNITLRQQDDYSEDDPVITIPLDSAERLAARILACAKEGREALDAEQGKRPRPEAQQRLALPAPDGKQPVSLKKNGETARTGAA
jgi:hypothetical protein